MHQNIVVGRTLLETITSALYENPIILFREYVQNSLDAYNYSVDHCNKAAISDFKVDITINTETRFICILDNGYGIAGPKKFKEDMLGFGNSDKQDRSEFIGFRGIGRLSALAFCEKLVFINKAEGATNEDWCTWRGLDYRNILNDGSSGGQTFESIVESITTFETKISTFAKEDHYFRVEIHNYTPEIDEIKGNPNFEQNLRRLLPIKYSPNFKSSANILSKYKQYMNEDLTKFMCSVYLDGLELRKNYYDEKHVRESGILFWEIRGKDGEKGEKGEKIGVLWFTFDKKMRNLEEDVDYGILVRSKNVLMGDNDTFADLCQNSKVHVATYKELLASIRCVYGELLINSVKLKDNARREWFRTDENSTFLKYIIVDFMGRLHKYRYAASHYFRKSSSTNPELKVKLKDALLELVDTNINSLNLNEYYKEELVDIQREKKSEMIEKPEMNNEHESKKTESDADNYFIETNYAEEDIPRGTQSERMFYNKIMPIENEFFEKEEKIALFLKMRAYIKNNFK